MKRPLDFVHIADLHLGYAQYNLEARLLDFNRAFEEAVDKILDIKPDFVLICGDLFHHPRPSNVVLEFAIEQLCRLKAAGVPVLAVDGSHDSAPNSVTGTILRPLDRAGLVVHLPSKPGSCCEGDGYYVYGMGYLRGRSKEAVLEDYVRDFPPRPDPSKFNIMAFHFAVAHEAVGPPGAFGRVRPEALPRGFDYYAGGHVHRPLLIELAELGLPGEGYLAYSGSTETVNYREAEHDKGFYLVSVSADKEIEVERVRLESPRKFIVFEESITGLSPPEATELILDRVKAMDERDAILVPIITGELPPGASLSEIDLTAIRMAARLALAVRPVLKVVEAELPELVLPEEREDIRKRAYRHMIEIFKGKGVKEPEKLAEVAIELIEPLLTGDEERVKALLEGLAREDQGG
ncbi:MAG TPA: DNA repair exonuclease [Candidatus Bathyarchaeota archaeon]|nr:MAG: hypothetical protein DRO60_04330 [Candidatus Bathyarchaeota archaeon]HDJ25853.1 DNA repair exonuclease [Candidatus Bathyarchaeota archaeon]